MTGILRPVAQSPEESSGFRLHYCSLCKATARSWGQLGRFFLSYDLCFLSFFLSSLSSDPLRTKETRCLVHPMKSQIIKQPDRIEDEILKAQFLLLEYQLLDYWKDESGWKKYLAIALHWLVKRKTKRTPPEIRDIVALGISDLQEKEDLHCYDMDHMALVFGHMMEGLVRKIADRCAIPISSEAKTTIRLIGKWVFFMDAIQDLREDVLRMRYNPLKYQYIDLFLGDQSLSESVVTVREKERWKVDLLISHLACSWNELRPEMRRYQEEWDRFFHYSIPAMSHSILTHGFPCLQTSTMEEENGIERSV